MPPTTVAVANLEKEGITITLRTDFHSPCPAKGKENEMFEVAVNLINASQVALAAIAGVVLFSEPVTVQDPCNIVRGRGLHDKLRFVVNAICSDFRDMDPRYEHNYCCQAGGGLINCGPPWKKSRMKSNRVKADQIAATGAHTVITPCHNCHSQIHDLSEHFEGGYHSVHLWTLICLSLGILGPNEREYLGEDLKEVNVFHPETAM